MNADVIIAGAGVAGLACAANLADSGLRVHVFERGSQPGGRAASWRDERTGDIVDIGPHVLTTEHLNFLALLRRLGSAEDVLWQPEPLITLYDDGRMIAMHGSQLPPPLHGLPNLRNTLRCVSPSAALSNLRIAGLPADARPQRLLLRLPAAQPGGPLRAGVHTALAGASHTHGHRPSVIGSG